MDDLKVIGVSVPRVDAMDKVTGQAKYVADINLTGMLVGKILRSPFPHARITEINVEKALALPGVRAVATGLDAPDRPISFMLNQRWRDKPVLPKEKVRYIGEEVAAVAAVNEEIADKALKLIDITYEQLPAAFSPDEAMAETASLIHSVPLNISNRFVKEVGSMSKGWAEADCVFEDIFSTPAISHSCMETHGCVANFKFNGDLEVWCSTQSPYYVKQDIAEIFNLPAVNIRVHYLTVGGGFGAKSRLSEADAITILLAKMTRSPVKIILTREEEIAFTRSRHPHVINLRTGVKKDGTITAREARIIIDNGAYNDVGPVLADIEGSRMASLYPVENVRVESLTVYTNNPYGGRFRAYGNSQITFAIESQMDIIAEKLGIDALEFRLRNAAKPNQQTSWGWKVSSCGLKECLQKVADGIGWKDEISSGCHRGVGFAGMTHRSGGSKGEYSAAYVKVANGGVEVISGITEIGQGAATILCQIAAETLGASFDSVRIISMDTRLTPIDLGSRSNRVTFMGGKAVLAAAQDARNQILERAAKYLGMAVEELTASEGVVRVKGKPEQVVSIKTLTSSQEPKGGNAIVGRGFYDQPVERGEATYVYGAQAVEVEVDLETGKVSLLKVILAQDVGRIINPLTAEGQLEGGAVQGVGWALMEEVVREKGHTLTPNFVDYKLPLAIDLPQFESVLVETNDPYGPYGAKGMGEPTVVAMAPAIANAIYRAIGVRVTDLPITPEKLLKTIRASRLNTEPGT